MRVSWRGALGIVLSVALMWWVLHDLNLRDVWAVLSQSSVPLWIACMVFATAIFPLRARRWAALLEPVAGRLPFRSLWQSTAVGMMVNNVVPARAGEFARAFALSRAEPSVKFTAAFASLAVDRLFDGTVVLLLMVIAMLDPTFARSTPGGSSGLVVSMRVAALFLVAVLLVLASLVVVPARIFALHDAVMVRVAPKFAPRTRSLLEGFASGLGVLRSPKLVAEVFFWTVLHWLCNAFAFWLGFQALGIEAPFTAALLTQGIIAIGVAIPQAPGFIGAFEAGGKIGLALYGLSETRAVSWALGFHILSYIPITVIGAVYLARLKLHLRDFRAADSGTA
jgi:glycosyltransferase 2 family protein